MKDMGTILCLPGRISKTENRPHVFSLSKFTLSTEQSEFSPNIHLFSVKFTDKSE